MKTIDILIVIPLIWGAYHGYRKGLLVEIVGVFAFMVAMIVGFKFLNFGIELLAPYISMELARRILPYLGFSVIFFPTVLLINRLGFSLRNSFKYSILGTLDNVAGGVVGAFTWVFGISTFFWLLSSFGVVIPPNQKDGSLLYPVVLPIAPKIISEVSDFIPIGGNLIRQWRAKQNY